jgi:Protein of unknown function (DUF1064)
LRSKKWANERAKIFDRRSLVKAVCKKMQVSGRSKFKSKITVADGVRFHSAKEAKRYKALKLLLATGEITDLRLQVKFELIPSQRDLYGKVIERAVTYCADFVYDENGVTIVEDVKGVKTKDYIIKRKLMLHLLRIRIREI